MPLPPGTRLGPYEVLGMIGAGGMGEVYRARDTRLDRAVALKILAPALASDPSRRARFDREARAISALDHAHVCRLHDVGEQDGQAYLVMEHLVGETLAQRLKKGPLSRPQALEVAWQIADALHAAHKLGIVHRDLKPSNVMLTRAGVKLLDFGLAHAAAGCDPGIGALAGALSTEADPLTEEGRLLGTLPYMAPEQVEGRPTDARTDVWALGAVLYEALTGRRAFDGQNRASLIAAILHEEPAPLSTLLPLAPPSLQRIVARCLSKSPDERWDTANDLAQELRWLEQPAADALVSGRRREGTGTMVAVGAIALAAGLGVGLAVARGFTRREHRPVIRSQLDISPAEALLGPLTLERRQIVQRPSRTALALSPDGRSLVFAAQQDGQTQLYLRHLDQAEANPLPGTQGALGPFFSPDGTWLGYWANRAFWKAALGGGGRPPVEVCPATLPWGASWGTDDRIVFSLGSGGLWQVPAAGGSPEPLTVLAPGEFAHVLPHVLPGGLAVVFTTIDSFYSWRSARVVVQQLPSGIRRVLAEDAADARYVPTGHVVFARRGNLMGFAFDPVRLTRTGSEIGLLTGVMQALNSQNSNLDSGAAQHSVSESGTLAYVTGGMMPTLMARLVSVDRSGHVAPLGAEPHRYMGLHLSPDGRRLALYVHEDLTTTAYSFDIARRALTRLLPLTRGGATLFPRWAPDGGRIAVAWSGEGRQDILLVDADGRWQGLGLVGMPAGWTPDGHGLVFLGNIARGNRSDILVHEFGRGGASSRALVSTAASEQWPELSPTGEWLAYASNETGRFEVYVRRFPDLGGRVQVSGDGGVSPLWSRDGRRLYYIHRTGEDVRGVLTEVPLAPGPSLTLGSQRRLFSLDDLNLLVTYTATGYTETPDGRGFIFAQSAPSEIPAPPSRIHLVQNWLDEMKQRLPAR